VTHVLGLSANGRRNKRLKRAVKMSGYDRLLDVGNVFGPIVGLRIHNDFNLNNKIIKKLQTSLF
jgi:hypothetical protein